MLVRAQSVDREDVGSMSRFETWAISFTPLCMCLSEGTLKAVGPFYLVSISGEVKYHLQRNGKTCRGFANSREGKL